MNALKQQLKKLIEFFRIGKLADLTRFRFQQCKNRRKNKAFLAQHRNLKLPRPFMIYETFNLDYKKYFLTGREDAEWIRREVEPFLRFEQIDILDWGCGPGRVIRHFPELVSEDVRLWACDYNRRYVQWCTENLDGVTFFPNELTPPLQLENETMNLIYGLSIFTHLSEERHYLWVDEMHRVLRKDGILFITTHGEVTKKNLLSEEIRKFEEDKLVVRGNIKEGYRLYCAYHPPHFVRKLIEGKFEVLRHRPGTEKDWGFEQDLWVLRKTNPS